MELKKLTEENAGQLKGKHIYLVRYFQDYIEELYAAYPLLPFIEGVIDTDTARQGGKAFHGRSFVVFGMEKLRTLPKNSALIITTGYFTEEFDALQKTGLPDTVGNIIYYFANRDTEYYEAYLEKYADTPLKNLIVFRSGMGTWEYVAGMDFTENARALFDYMLAEGYNRRYEMVWLVKDPERYREVEHRNENVHFVSYDWATSEKEQERDAYYEAICLARYFLFTHACGFCRLPRKGQIRIQLWHGCGFKTVKNVIPQKRRYEYTTVVSKLYAQLHEKEFGLEPNQMIVTGYAKEDWLFHPVKDWKERLNIPKAAGYIFWLPTFRTARSVVSYMNVRGKNNQSGLPVAGTLEELHGVNDFLKEQNTVLVVKLHPLQKRENIYQEELSNILVLDNETLASADLHINQILGHANALISDYSSAAIDFLLLDRPIAFTLDDLEEYEESRGFVLNPIRDWIPGEKILSLEDYMEFLQNVTAGKDTAKETRRSLTAKLHDFQDDQSSRRIVEFLKLE
ncbi:MAG: hypothetical protein HFH89_05630 [Lachnospiraceae bacterium]|nr:CDP-glycerol glycerophosphotransferase family protein [uncultured Acetatifactor sp.]MCI8287132.1 hypothetical protein [Lachnospiraceae bacterium]